jgi:homoprotocatechuate degradation regulator HpaR
MDRFRPHLAAHDVTEQQWRVLRALAEVGEIDASTLAEISCLLPPSLSRMMQDLEARGLLDRRRPQGDRRTTLIRLSKDGRALFETMSKRSEAIYRDLETDLAAAGCSSILTDLDRLIAALAPGAAHAETHSNTKPLPQAGPKPEKV